MSDFYLEKGFDIRRDLSNNTLKITTTSRTEKLQTPDITILIKKKYFIDFFNFEESIKETISQFIKYKIKSMLPFSIMQWYEKSGVISLFNVSDITTNLNKNGEGRFSLAIPNPRNVLTIKEEDLELLGNAFKFFKKSYLIQPHDKIHIFASTGEEASVQIFEGIVGSIRERYEKGAFSLYIEGGSTFDWLKYDVSNISPTFYEPESKLFNYKNDEGRVNTGILGVTKTINMEEIPHHISATTNIFAKTDPANIISVTITGVPYSPSVFLSTSSVMTILENIRDVSKTISDFIPALYVTHSGSLLEEFNSSNLLTKVSKQLTSAQTADEIEELNGIIADELYNISIKTKANGNLKVNSNSFTKSIQDVIDGVDKNYLLIDSEYDSNLYIKSYQSLFKPANNVWANNFVSSDVICKEAADIIDFDFFCNEDGHLIFQPPKFNRTPPILLENDQIWTKLISTINEFNNQISNNDVKLKIDNFYKEALKQDSEGRSHVIEDIEIISYGCNISSPEFTRLDLIGQGLEGVNQGMKSLWTGAVDYDLWRVYGYKFKQISKPYFDTDTPLKVTARDYYALGLINKQKFNQYKMNLVMAPNLNIRVTDTVYISSLDRIYYVAGVAHNISYGKNWSMTLNLELGRKPDQLIVHPFTIISQLRDIFKMNT